MFQLGSMFPCLRRDHHYDCCCARTHKHHTYTRARKTHITCATTNTITNRVYRYHQQHIHTHAQPQIHTRTAVSAGTTNNNNGSPSASLPGRHCRAKGSSGPVVTPTSLRLVPPFGKHQPLQQGRQMAHARWISGLLQSSHGARRWAGGWCVVFSQMCVVPCDGFGEGVGGWRCQERMGICDCCGDVRVLAG